MLPDVEIQRLKDKVITRADLPSSIFNALFAAGAGKRRKDLVGEEDIIPADALAALRPERLLSVSRVGQKGVDQIRGVLQKLAKDSDASQE